MLEVKHKILVKLMMNDKNTKNLQAVVTNECADGIQKQSTQTAQRAVSGSGMDRKVANKSPLTQKLLLPVIIILFMTGVGYLLTNQTTGKALSVDTNRIVISNVSSGVFEDFIPIRGRVKPAKTVYLDAIEGGRVERVLVEDGVALADGDLIVELSNASLQLNVLSNEARVAEQLNNIRTIELNLEQNRLSHKRNLADINYQIKLLTRQLGREQELLSSGAINQSQHDDTKDTLDWYKSRLALTLESQASDSKMQEEQLVFLTSTGKRLASNLALSQQNLESMNVRAPVSGKLSGFNVEVGQSIGRGERLGQIDTPNDYKLSAFIDEFYLGRIDIGQQATYKDYELVVAKIYPQVQNGQFEIDFRFVGEQPTDIRRGQTLQTKLTLGDASEAVLIPSGAFYQDTGGKWIFVVTESGNEAVRRNVRLGRKNNQFIEVIDGLEIGERVVTSPYSSYQDMQRLKLTQ